MHAFTLTVSTAKLSQPARRVPVARARLVARGGGSEAPGGKTPASDSSALVPASISQHSSNILAAMPAPKAPTAVAPTVVGPTEPTRAAVEAENHNQCVLRDEVDTLASERIVLLYSTAWTSPVAHVRTMDGYAVCVGECPKAAADRVARPALPPSADYEDVEFGTLCQTDTKSSAGWPKVAILPRTASFCISNRLLDADEWDNCNSVPFYDYHIDTPGAPAAACQRDWVAPADAPCGFHAPKACTRSRRASSPASRSWRSPHLREGPVGVEGGGVKEKQSRCK